MASTPLPDLDEARRRELRRSKSIAVGLLVLAAVVFVIARILEVDRPGFGYLRATAEAAMVGAFADWFAVTALFRHPLGIPIPHTAIVQTRKDQIGESLGGFVQDNFLTAEVVGERLSDAEMAGKIGTWLSDPANAKTVSAQSAAVVRGVTEVLQDDLVQGGLEAVIAERARAISVAPLVGRAVDIAVDGGHHQVLLDGVLTSLGSFMEDNRLSFRDRLYKESPWWVPEPVDDVVFDKIYAVVQKFVGELSEDKSHELRVEIDRRSAQFAADLKTSPELQARGEELKEELLAHPEVRAWSSTLWTRMKAGLLEATEDPESELRRQLDTALVEAGQSLVADPELRRKIDRWIIDATSYVAEQFRGEVANLIASTVQRWDTDETVERLELQVGRDLQFIRVNGTLVGGLVGLIIYSASEFFF